MTSLPPDLRKLKIEPVRRLRSPMARALTLAPLGILILVLTPLWFGLRSDLGWALAWGASVVQMVLGLGCIGLALRESIPGRATSSRTLALTATAAATVVGAIAVLTNAASAIAPRNAWEVGRICFGGTMALAIPILLAAGILCVRAYPIRPWLAGLFYGLGAGLIADSGWRLFCGFSTLDHLVSYHMAPTVLAALAGMLLSSVLSRYL